MKPLDEKTVKARIRGEQARTLENIAARTELPKQQWWLSFADADGFRGVAIVHALDFTEAVMECNLHECNPHGEVQGMPIPEQVTIPKEFTYRVLSREECAKLDDEIIRPQVTGASAGPAKEGA